MIQWKNICIVYSFTYVRDEERVKERVCLCVCVCDKGIVRTAAQHHFKKKKKYIKRVSIQL